MKKVIYRFDVVDYLIFAAMLILSAATGIYIAWRDRAKRDQPDRLKDYLTGNKTMKAFPVSMSLIACYVSGITIVGTPAEIYNFGSEYWMVVFAMSFSGLCVATVYLPVFVELQVCSSYEYLELRFHKVLRTIASFFFLLDEIMFLPFLIYVPSLAFNQVTGVHHHTIGTIVCAICVFYTYLGGIKAVVYTDTWQTIIMYISVLVVVILGVIEFGGFDSIVDIAYKGGRMGALNFNPSMYERYTIFSVLIGGFTYWTAFNSVNQTMVQRYVSLSLRQAKFSVALFTVGVVFFISLCCFCGVMVYSTYHECDPLISKRISTDDQLLPLYVMEAVGHVIGIPGLFIAGIFGAALSSLSVVLNSTAVVLLEDFFKGVFHFKLTERVATIITKVIITTLGVVAVALVFVLERIGTGVLELATTFSAIASGTMFGVFSLGMLVPWANTKGAVAGAIGGFIVSGVLAYGRQIVVAHHYVMTKKLTVSIDKCEKIYGIANLTLPNIIPPDESNVFPLFRIAYLWITPIGFCSVITIGVITSFITGKTDIRYLDPDLISPVSKWMLPKEAQRYAGTALSKVKHQRLLPSTPLELTDMREQGPSGNR